MMTEWSGVYKVSQSNVYCMRGGGGEGGTIVALGDERQMPVL